MFFHLLTGLAWAWARAWTLHWLFVRENERRAGRERCDESTYIHTYVTGEKSEMNDPLRVCTHVRAWVDSFMT